MDVYLSIASNYTSLWYYLGVIETLQLYNKVRQIHMTPCFSLVNDLCILFEIKYPCVLSLLLIFSVINVV